MTSEQATMELARELGAAVHAHSSLLWDTLEEDDNLIEYYEGVIRRCGRQISQIVQAPHDRYRVAGETFEGSLSELIENGVHFQDVEKL